MAASDNFLPTINIFQIFYNFSLSAPPLLFLGGVTLPDRKVWCTASPIRPVKCIAVLDVPYKGSCCTGDVCYSRPCVESYGVEKCPSSIQATHPPPPKPLTPSTKATTDSVHKQPSRGVDWMVHTKKVC
jgi:hypothetical protein